MATNKIEFNFTELDFTALDEMVREGKERLEKAWDDFITSRDLEAETKKRTIRIARILSVRCPICGCHILAEYDHALESITNYACAACDFDTATEWGD